MKLIINATLEQAHLIAEALEMSSRIRAGQLYVVHELVKRSKSGIYAAEDLNSLELKESSINYHLDILKCLLFPELMGTMFHGAGSRDVCDDKDNEFDMSTVLELVLKEATGTPCHTIYDPRKGIKFGPGPILDVMVSKEDDDREEVGTTDCFDRNIRFGDIVLFVPKKHEAQGSMRVCRVVKSSSKKRPVWREEKTFSLLCVEDGFWRFGYSFSKKNRPPYLCWKKVSPSTTNAMMVLPDAVVRVFESLTKGAPISSLLRDVRTAESGDRVADDIWKWLYPDSYDRFVTNGGNKE